MMLLSEHKEQESIVLDIGGEGRHPEAWNLNPSVIKTVGKVRGTLIPRHIQGRADDIPFSDGSVERIIVERTPLQVAALHEIARVIVLNGTITLRHARPPFGDPHALAKQVFRARWTQRIIHLGGQVVQETEFHLSSRTDELEYGVSDRRCFA